MKPPFLAGNDPNESPLQNRQITYPDGGLRSHKAFARVLRRTGFSDQFIFEVLSQLPDPIDLQRDQQILAHYRLSSERLMDRLGGSP